ncbi:MAG: hypothetical protein KF785_08280 [Gemmatimonadales bacterium]|nr:hypothetical protein [Gemmatimonadales bacterium]
MLQQIPLQDLRRVAGTLQALKGETIGDCVMRSDLRQLKVELDDGRILVVAIELDDAGRPHLSVDVALPLDELGPQLEVNLDSGAA